MVAPGPLPACLPPPPDVLYCTTYTAPLLCPQTYTYTYQSDTAEAAAGTAAHSTAPYGAAPYGVAPYGVAPDNNSSGGGNPYAYSAPYGNPAPSYGAAPAAGPTAAFSPDRSGPEVLCECGKPCVSKVSTTQKNPNRRFYRCPALDGQECRFFK